FGPARYRRWRSALPAVAALILLAALAVELRVGADVGSYFGGALLVDRFGLFVKAAVLLATAVGIAVADWGAEDSISIGLAMPMLAAFGVMVVASGGDFLSVWAVCTARCLESRRRCHWPCRCWSSSERSSIALPWLRSSLAPRTGLPRRAR